MGGDFQRDLKDSMFDFQRVVLPQLQKSKFISGELISIEQATAEGYAHLVKAFDYKAGIDLIQVKNEGLCGVANRVQWVPVAGRLWNSFTIRMSRASGAKTEYEKRMAAVMSNGQYLYPYLTIQAFVQEPRRSGPLLSVAVAKTTDILQAAWDDTAPEKDNKQDGNKFKAVFWQDMKREYPIKIFEALNLKSL
jgi:hypothetical protein